MGQPIAEERRASKPNSSLIVGRDSFKRLVELNPPSADSN